MAELQEMMQKLYGLAQLEPPSFPIMKDIFDQLDANKDGIVDKNEWMNAFSYIQRKGESQSDSTGASSGHEGKDSIGKWKEVKSFEDLINSVARNRKLIQDYVGKKEKGEVVTSNQRQLAHHLATQLVHKKHVLQAIYTIVGREQEMGRLIENLVEPFAIKEGTSQGKDQLFDFGRFLETIKQRALEKTGFPIV